MPIEVCMSVGWGDNWSLSVTLIDWVFTPIPGDFEGQKSLPRFVSGKGSAVRGQLAQCHAGKHSMAWNDDPEGGSWAVHTASEPELLMLQLIPLLTPLPGTHCCYLCAAERKEMGKRHRGSMWWVIPQPKPSLSSQNLVILSSGIGKTLISRYTPHKQGFFTILLPRYPIWEVT